MKSILSTYKIGELFDILEITSWFDLREFYPAAAVAVQARVSIEHTYQTEIYFQSLDSTLFTFNFSNTALTRLCMILTVNAFLSVLMMGIVLLGNLAYGYLNYAKHCELESIKVDIAKSGVKLALTHMQGLQQIIDHYGKERFPKTLSRVLDFTQSPPGGTPFDDNPNVKAMKRAIKSFSLLAFSYYSTLISMLKLLTFYGTAAVMAHPLALALVGVLAAGVAIYNGLQHKKYVKQKLHIDISNSFLTERIGHAKRIVKNSINFGLFRQKRSATEVAESITFRDWNMATTRRCQ